MKPVAMVRSMNVSEERLGRVLSSLDHRAIPQARIGPYTVDFLLPGIKVVVEADSILYHSNPDKVRRDRLRDSHLQGLGYLTIHVWTHDLLTPRGRGKVKYHILWRLAKSRRIRSHSVALR